jgi:hypothetical protein
MLLVAFGSATDIGPSFPGKINYMPPNRSFRLDRCRCDSPSGRSLNDGWCGAQPRIEVYGDS